LLDVFDKPVIARCQLHKLRNVTDKLPEKLLHSGVANSTEWSTGSGRRTVTPRACSASLRTWRSSALSSITWAGKRPVLIRVNSFSVTSP
jgi:hypothetical protein